MKGWRTCNLVLTDTFQPTGGLRSRHVDNTGSRKITKAYSGSSTSMALSVSGGTSERRDEGNIIHPRCKKETGKPLRYFDLTVSVNRNYGGVGGDQSGAKFTN